MLIMFEKNRGGIVHSAHKYVKEINKYMKSFDKSI